MVVADDLETEGGEAGRWGMCISRLPDVHHHWSHAGQVPVVVANDLAERVYMWGGTVWLVLPERQYVGHFLVSRYAEGMRKVCRSGHGSHKSMLQRRTPK